MTGPLRGPTCTSRWPRRVRGTPRSRTRCARRSATGGCPRGRGCPRRARSPAISASRAARSSRPSRSCGAEGYLEARHGAGTWVAELSPAVDAPAPRRREPGRAPRASASAPGVPDLTSFPQAAWMSALRQGLRGRPPRSLGYGDPARPARPARAARVVPRSRARGARRPRARDRLRGLPPRALARRARAPRDRRAARSRWRTRARLQHRAAVAACGPRARAARGRRARRAHRSARAGSAAPRSFARAPVPDGRRAAAATAAPPRSPGRRPAAA